MGNYKGAMEDIEKALQIDDDNSYWILHVKGVIEHESGQHDAAVKTFDEVIEKNPKFSECYFYRGKARAALGHAEEAMQDIRESIRLGELDDDKEEWLQEAKQKLKDLEQ